MIVIAETKTVMVVLLIRRAMTMITSLVLFTKDIRSVRTRVFYKRVIIHANSAFWHNGISGRVDAFEQNEIFRTSFDLFDLQWRLSIIVLTSDLLKTMFLQINPRRSICEFLMAAILFALPYPRSPSNDVPRFLFTNKRYSY